MLVQCRDVPVYNITDNLRNRLKVSDIFHFNHNAIFVLICHYNFIF